MKKYLLSCAVIISAVCLFIPALTYAQQNLTTPTQNVMFDKVIRTYQEEGFHGVLWNYAFNGVQWLSDDSLAVTGNCNIRQDNTGGLYIFDEDGVYKEKQNSCHHTSNTRVACPEGGGCQMGWQVAEKDSYLIREGQAPSGVRRSPLVYSKSGTALSYISRLFFTDKDDDIRYPTGDMDEWEEWAAYYSPVVVGDTLVTFKTGTGLAYSSSYNKLVGLSVPNLSVQWEEFAEGTIAGAIGDVLILSRINTLRPVTTTLIAYHVEDDGLVELSRTQYPGAAMSTTGSIQVKIDGRDPSICAFAITGEGNSSCSVRRFRRTDSGIEEIDERTYSLGVGGGCGADFAILDEYVVFTVGTQGMRAWKGMTELTVELPEELSFEPGSGLPTQWDGRLLGVDIREDGKIAVAMGNRAVLYTISSVVTPPPPPPPPDPNPVPPNPTPDPVPPASGMAAMVQAYVQFIEAFVNSH